MIRHAWDEGVSRHKTASTAAGHVQRHGAHKTSSSPRLPGDIHEPVVSAPLPTCAEPCLNQCTRDMRPQADARVEDGKQFMEEQTIEHHWDIHTM
jgi:hypothetical protein